MAGLRSLTRVAGGGARRGGWRRRARRRRAFVGLDGLGGVEVSRRLDARAASAGHLRFASDERTHWHFIPHRNLPAQRADRQGNESGSARRRSRPAEDRLEPARLSDGDLDHGSRESARRHRSGAAPPPAAQPPRRRAARPRPGALLLLRVRHAVGKDTWGWRVEGHHVSLHFTVVNGTLVAGSPTFFGANPAEVREGPKKGLRVLGAGGRRGARAARIARRVAARKGDHQRDRAERHLTMAKVEIEPLSPRDRRVARERRAQRDLLMKLIDVYVGYMAADIAADRRARLKKAGVEKIAFAWAGETEKGQEALLPRSGSDVPHRVRQHPERRQPHPLGLARLQWRLRPRPAARASGVQPALTTAPLELRDQESQEFTGALFFCEIGTTIYGRTMRSPVGVAGGGHQPQDRAA